MLHATEKTLKDLGEKVTSEERYKIETAISALKTALSGDDKDAIENRTQELAQASAAVAQRAYSQQGPSGAPGADAGASAGAGGTDASGGGGKDDVLDAEFEEVKDKGRKSS